LAHVLKGALYPLFRRLDFRGKGRLRGVLAVPSDGTEEITLPGGARLRLDLRESVQRDYLFGLNDKQELDLVLKLLRGADFVDVGAHVGLYAVTVASATPGRVLAFEPNPRARAQLVLNISLNELANVIVVPKAAAAVAGRGLLHVPDTHDTSFSSLEAGRFAEGEPVEVDVTTVDEEVTRAGLHPTVVKIDVEGAELAVLEGMRATIERHRPAIVCELHGTHREVAAALAAHDYRVVNLEGPEPIERDAGANHVLGLPPLDGGE
jgi:FkbM family methyltransferase